MNRLGDVVDAIRYLAISVEKEELINSLTEIYDIPVHKCNKCDTNSITYLENEGEIYCLFCNESRMNDFEYAECECSGLGIIEDICDRDGICEEVAICLKCNKKIPKDSCYYSGDTGYNFPVVMVDIDEETGEKVYEPVCYYCYEKLHEHEHI